MANRRLSDFQRLAVIRLLSRHATLVNAPPRDYDLDCYLLIPGIFKAEI